MGLRGTVESADSLHLDNYGLEVAYRDQIGTIAPKELGDLGFARIHYDFISGPTILAGKLLDLPLFSSSRFGGLGHGSRSSSVAGSILMYTNSSPFTNASAITLDIRRTRY